MIEMLSIYDYYFSKKFKEWKGMGKSKRKRGGRVKIMYNFNDVYWYQFNIQHIDCFNILY